MSLYIDRLKVLVNTEQDDIGVDIKFNRGLVILRADNTKGKSTCIKSIIYALGLERLFGPGSKPPLPPSMTNLIKIKDQEYPVLESNVYLEISNEKEEQLTINRKVVGNDDRDWRLIKVWDGPALTKPNEDFCVNSYFARDPGAASREEGFHTRLADFIGWDLPEVLRYNGSSCPLYMELILPLFYIEQMNGWSSIQATTPSYFQVREPQKRAVEFMLRLDIYHHESEKAKIDIELNAIKEKWRSRYNECKSLVKPLGWNIVELPSEPVISWPPEVNPYIEVYHDSSWMALSDSLKSDKNQLKELEETEIPTVEEVTSELSEELDKAYTKLNREESIMEKIIDDVEIETAQLDAINNRLVALEEDLRKNQDLLKLRKFGASEDLSITKGKCPTCNQAISDSLLDQTILSDVMSVEANVEFLKSQRGTFKKMKENAEKVINAKERQLASVREDLRETKSSIRGIKLTLISDGRIPSLEAVRKRIVLQDRISLGERILDDLQAILEGFNDLSNDWKDLIAKKKNLPKGVSQGDKDKLTRLQELLIEQEKQYGFTSMPLEEIHISRDDYHPTREGYDLVYDISASDNIRTIASYAVGLSEVAREFDTNHCGFVILDEPRQQSLMLRNLKGLFERLKSSLKYGQQVIIATSEEESNLENIINDPSVQYHSFDEWILSPFS